MEFPIKAIWYIGNGWGFVSKPITTIVETNKPTLVRVAVAVAVAPAVAAGADFCTQIFCFCFSQSFI